MHARSTTFDGMPDRIDAGMELMMNEVRPAIEATDGCLGMSCLLDRPSGELIVTTSWETREAMRQSQESLMDLRMRVSDALGGSMRMDPWEIALMHHGEHGMFARVGWVQGDVDRIVSSFREMGLPSLEQRDGFCGASVLTNAADNMCCVTTTYTDMNALMDTRDMSEQVREMAMTDAGATVTRLMEYELTYAHLNVPELV